ncbi:hypothetical protein SMD20_08155 [Nonomuraea sp. LP-02]|uniref:hypothetical protein n=1 Tax=Nonomuraea sp. LP-02 TaxID=3097960 RepID=UPI002E375CFF|nr:hypothetical protein [Nonomuraea sp. LP-02]MED7924201.1 hypothetical protein [Nonomuraea sp. LP-02]
MERSEFSPFPPSVSSSERLLVPALLFVVLAVAAVMIVTIAAAVLFPRTPRPAARD